MKAQPLYSAFLPA